MQNIKLMLLRGVCQNPAYAACCKGFFEQEGLAAQFKITHSVDGAAAAGLG